jgi:hypothetical protein
MRLAKILTDEGDDLIRGLRASGDPATLSRILGFTQSIRRDAYYAYLDGRPARAKALSKFADKIARAALKIRLRQNDA